MQFCLKLNALLKEKGITQKQLSEGTGISRAMISEYLSDKKGPSFENVQKITSFLNISLDTLSGFGSVMVIAEPEAQYITGNGLGTNIEVKIVKNLTKLNNEQKELILKMTKEMIKEK